MKSFEELKAEIKAMPHPEFNAIALNYVKKCEDIHHKIMDAVVGHEWILKQDVRNAIDRDLMNKILIKYISIDEQTKMKFIDYEGAIEEITQKLFGDVK